MLPVAFTIWLTANANPVGAGAPAALLRFTPDELAQIKAMGPWPPVARRDLSNRVDGLPRAVRLGEQLFRDPRLSRGGELSCASCHRPDRAFQDGRTVAVGGAPGVRNTPSLLDVAWQRWFGWDGGHDSLWWASLAPMLDHREMGHDLQSLANRVRGLPDWAGRYQQVFDRPVPRDDKILAVDLAKALAAYQATLVSRRTAFDAFRDALVSGDNQAAARYPLAAQRGLRLFIGHGRCTTCHAGPGFSNGEFADVGVGFFVPGGVDSGRHSGLKSLIGHELNRLGRFNDSGGRDPSALLTKHVFLDHRHFGEFKVPGLRQLVHTAPYMHNGSLGSLAAVVSHYNEIDLERLHADGARILRPLGLDARGAADLVAFLRTLSSPLLTGSHRADRGMN